jgi:hypothetical protein
MSRLIDLLVFHPSGSESSQPLSLSLAGSSASGLGVTGILKVIQRFFLELFTVRGTLRGLPNRGCSFMADAWQGLWQTPVEVQSSFAAALSQIKLNLRADIAATDPADEQFETAELADIQLAADTVKLYIRLFTKAGDSRIVLAPLPLTAVTRRTD